MKIRWGEKQYVYGVVFMGSDHSNVQIKNKIAFSVPITQT
jgi:hypothetical protein